MRFRVLASAEREADEAFDWYEHCQVGLGDAFIDALMETYRVIERDPLAFAVSPDAPEGREIQQKTTHRFPYLVVYEVRSDEILVLAVAHTSRRAGYWIHRNGGTP